DVCTPKAYHIDLDHHLMILEDFGDITASKYLASPTCTQGHEKALFEKAIDIIHNIFYEVGEDESQSIIAPYEDSIYLDEVGLFTNYYYEYIHKEKIDPELTIQWSVLWQKQLHHIWPMSPDTLVLRDFHVDNLMILDQGLLGVLDFQDALYGSIMYDYISLVEDARRDMDAGLKAHLQTYFLQIFDPSDHKDLLHAADVLGALRHAKVLGAFTRYALLKGNKDKLCHLDRTKKYFIDALERAELKEILHFTRDLGLL
ncbi:MAG: phosphotransferase, partial [Alphaproteobacteria bacterium]|nr:phosphotransferase [Alphaproteobacteria bacterium]